MTTEAGHRPGDPWSARAISRVKPWLFLASLYPVFRWVVLAFLVPGGLTANPPEFLIRSSGLWSLVFLLLTLCVTPVRRLLGQPLLIRMRRMLGLFSFFYAALHVAGWAWWEHGAALASMWEDVLQRTFVWVGLLALVPMMFMAITSTRGWMKRLGRGWQRLHASIYGVAVLSVWHFWLVRSGKVDYLEPFVYGGLLFLILALRAVGRHRIR